MSLAGDLSLRTLERIAQRFGMDEVHGPDGPFEVLRPVPPGLPDGACRVFRGDRVVRMVYVGLGVPPMGLDSHMIFAFADGGSPLPHFTLDAVLAGGHYAFHCDLMPRVDLGAHLPYLDAVFTPLSDTYEEVRGVDGLTPAVIGRRQWAVMSPWMLAYRADEKAFKEVEPAIDAYLEHWAGLVERGLPDGAEEGIDASWLPERDRRNRAIVFNPSVDPVWNQIAPLIGDETGERLRGLLRGEVPVA
jgi:hypothetical protein